MRQPFPAVVIRENDEGVLSQSTPLERGEDFADALVRPLEHPDIVFPRRRNGIAWTLIQPQVARRPALWHVVTLCVRHVWRLERPVNGVIRNLDEERTRGMPVDEAHRTTGNLVG